MIDVVLLAAAFSVSVSLPRFLFDGRIEQGTMALSLCLSLSLFSLTIIEGLPQSVRLVLSNTNWVTSLYFYLLWLLSILIVIVLPGLCGAAWAELIGNFFCSSASSSLSPSSNGSYADADDKKHLSPFLRRMSSCPWWLRFFVTTIRVAIHFVMFCLCRSCSLVSSSTRQYASTTPTSSKAGSILSTRDSTASLVMTVHDQQYDDLKTSLSCSSSEIHTMVDGGSPPSPSGKRNSVVSLSQSSGSTAGSQKPTLSYSQYTSKLRCWMLAGSVCCVLSVIIVLRIMGPVVVRSPPTNRISDGADWPADNSHQSSFGLSIVVSWLCAVGLLLSSVLNGFGSVSMPYTYLAGLFLKPVRPETIAKLSLDLQNLQETVLKKRALLREPVVDLMTPRSSITMPTVSSSKSHRSSVKSSTGAFGGIGSDMTEELKHRREFLKTEIDFLEDIIKETTMDLDELRYSQTVAMNARTGLGKVKSLIGVFFSVILLLRLFNAGYIIWASPGYYASIHNHLGSKKSGDIVTSTLLWLTGNNYVSAKRYALLSQMVSLTLAAVLSFSQVRFFLRTVTIVNRRLTRFYHKLSCGPDADPPISTSTPKGQQPPSSTMNRTQIVSTHSQVIAGLLGCYSLACIVLIKMMLPGRFSVAFSTALGVEGIFVINSHVVNWVFFWSAMVSSAILGVLLSIQRQNTFRYASETSKKGFHDRDKGYSFPDV